MPAGPSEERVSAEETAVPALVGSDLLAQAEHGPDSQVILVCIGPIDRSRIEKELEKQTLALPRREIVEKALENSYVLSVDTADEAVGIANDYAPEHLILATHDAESMADSIRNAGSVFIGNYSPESAGDYASGTNHTLPTNGAAKAWSGITIRSFQKTVLFQQLTPTGLKRIGQTVMQMAENEQLTAHRNAVGIRLQKLSEEESL